MSAHSRALSGQMTAAQKRLEEIDVLRRHILTIDSQSYRRKKAAIHRGAGGAMMFNIASR